jgi:hypothetical protein
MIVLRPCIAIVGVVVDQRIVSARMTFCKARDPSRALTLAEGTESIWQDVASDD